MTEPEQTTRPSRPAAGSAASLSHKLRLIGVLSRREIEGRYRGSVLGIVWSMITPLLMLGIYTFVFGTVFTSRWPPQDNGDVPGSFSVILFAGLILFQIFSEVVNRAPTLILSNLSYVKRVVFPLEILVPVSVATALFHAAVSLLILLPFIFITFGSISPTALLLPLCVAPLLLYTLGLGWFLASLGTYWRDIGQITATVTTALLFLAPIFFPLSALPEWIQPVLILNPVSLPIEQTRAVLLFGHLPDFVGLGIYTAIGALVCAGGYMWFQATRKGFADVL